MKILITGANGYIGNCLIKTFLKNKNIHIVGVSGKESKFRNKNYTHIKLNIKNTHWVNNISKPVDIIIHLASPKPRTSNAKLIRHVNIDVTMQLLEWTRKNPVKKFLFASSGNVYSNNLNPSVETDIVAPDSAYAKAKLLTEQKIKNFDSSFQYIIMRIFTVYGPCQKDRLIPNIIEKVFNSKNIQLAHNIGLKLSPLYIDDCVKMIKSICFLKSQNCNEVVNLAGKEIISLGKIVELIGKELNMLPKIKVTKEYPKFLHGSSHKLQKLINLNQLTPFKKGLKKTLASMKMPQ